MLIATGDGQAVVASGNCIDHSRCYGQLSCRALRPSNANPSTQEAFDNELYSSAAAMFQSGTHTVLMRSEAQPETDSDWQTFVGDMIPPGNPWAAYYTSAAFKVDLGELWDLLLPAAAGHVRALSVKLACVGLMISDTLPAQVGIPAMLQRLARLVWQSLHLGLHEPGVLSGGRADQHIFLAAPPHACMPVRLQPAASKLPQHGAVCAWLPARPGPCPLLLSYTAQHWPLPCIAPLSPT
jgi:hypothetical protein